MPYDNRRPSGHRPEDHRRRPASSERRRAPAGSRKRRKRRYRLRLRAKVLLVLFLAFILFGMGRCAASAIRDKGPVEDTSLAVADTDQAIQPKDIAGHSAIAIDAKSGKVLFAKAADEQKYPASLTKLMTVYVALQEEKDLDREVEFTADMFEGLAEKDLATAGYQVGDKATIEDLLYATILPSGADAARALAIATAGSESAFVDLMNTEAQSLGMRGTYFKNVTGAHNPKHISTAADMAKLLRAGLKNDTFAQVVQTMHYTTGATSTAPDGLTLNHSLARYLDHFDRVMTDPPFEILGGKTGYTHEAGLCLATVARDRDNNDHAIVVVLDGKGNAGNYYPVLKDSAVLYDAIFTKIK